MKKNLGCEELRQAILAAIDWDELPCRTTEVLFKRLKEEIIRLKDEGRVLMRFNELRETLQLRLSGELKRLAGEELRAVLTLLAGHGVGVGPRLIELGLYGRICGPKWHSPAAGGRVRYSWRAAATRTGARKAVATGRLVLRSLPASGGNWFRMLAAIIML